MKAMSIGLRSNERLGALWDVDLPQHVNITFCVCSRNEEFNVWTMTDKHYRHWPEMAANQGRSLALETLDSVRISTRDLAQVLVRHSMVSKRDPCSIPTATHRRAYDGWLDAVCGKRLPD